MSFIVTGFIIGIFFGYLHALPPARRMFCSGCTEDEKRERYVHKRIVLKSVVLSKELSSKHDDEDETSGSSENESERTCTPENSERCKLFSSVQVIGRERKNSKLSGTAFICPKSQTLIEASSACAICWGTYKDGETVCLSSNKRCNHAYHFDCILPWLLKRSDCPLCRRNFLKG